jgi:small subunit ribosomal protein S21
LPIGWKGFVNPGGRAIEVAGAGFHLGRGTVCVVQWQRSVWSVEVQVRDNNVDQALRALKKKMQREGLYREMRMRRHYEKPSEKRARERAEAIRRFRKLQRKRRERDEI